MKPTFALNLSHDGIGLYRREGSGWTLLGETALEAPDLSTALDALRRRAEAAAPQGVRSKLIIPASQILYTEIEAPGPGTAQRRRQIAAALEGMTPYPVEELAFDWSGHGEVVQVAVVARETLAEAEAFAETYGFNPLSFVAIPAPGQFAGEPWFGPTRGAATLLPEGSRIERDQDPVRVNIPAAPVTPEAVPDAAPQSDPVAQLAATDEAAAEPAADPAGDVGDPGVDAGRVMDAGATDAPTPDLAEVELAEVGLAGSEDPTPVEDPTTLPETAAEDAPESRAEAPVALGQIAFALDLPEAPAARAQNAPPTDAVASEEAPHEEGLREEVEAEEAPHEEARIEEAGIEAVPTEPPADEDAQDPAKARAPDQPPAEPEPAQAPTPDADPAAQPAPGAAPLAMETLTRAFAKMEAEDAAAQARFGPDQGARPDDRGQDVGPVPETAAADAAPPLDAVPLDAVPHDALIEEAASQGTAETAGAEDRAGLDTAKDTVTADAPDSPAEAREAEATAPAPLDAPPADTAAADTGPAPDDTAVAAADPAAGETSENRGETATEDGAATLVAFSSRRAALGAAPASPTAPRLGGVGRLTPVAPDRTAAPRKLGGTGPSAAGTTGAGFDGLKLGVTAPGLALPADPVPTAPKAAAKALARAASVGLGRAASGTARRAGAAGRALAAGLKSQAARKRPTPLPFATPGAEKPADPKVADAQPGSIKPADPKSAGDKIASAPFGSRSLGGRRQVGGKPKHLGLVLTGGLVGFIAIVALWSSFLVEEPASTAPTAEIAAADAVSAPEGAVAPVAPVGTETAAASETAPATEIAPPTEVAPLTPTPPAATAQAPAAPLRDAPGDLPGETETAALVPNASSMSQPLDPAATGAPAPKTAPPAATTTAATTAAAAPSADPATTSGQPNAETLEPAQPAPTETASGLTLPRPDPALSGTDAQPLPGAETLVDTNPVAPAPPPPFEQLARISPDGQLEPTPQGVIHPGGFTLYSGRPERVPAARPAAIAASAATTPLPDAATPPVAETAAAPVTADPATATAEAPAAAPYADPALAGLRPRNRPAAIAAAAAPEATEDGAALPLADPALARLAELRPRARPAAVTRAAEAAAAEEARRIAAEAAEAEAAAAAEAARFAGATTQAVEVSRRPTTRPRDLASSVEQALAAAIAAEPVPTPVAAAAPAQIPAAAPAAPPAPAPAPAAAPKTAEPEVELDEPEPTSAMPNLPTSASVAKQATLRNGIQLGEMNLVGLFGSSGSRRALVRMPNGKFVKVAVGDRLDGGKVTAIGEGQLTYQKGSRAYTLKLLKGS